MKDKKRSGQLSLAGIRIDAIGLQDLLHILDVAKEERSKRLILNHNLHSLHLYLTVAKFRELYAQATNVYVDGMPLVWLGRLAGLPIEATHRITFLDCFDEILSHAQSEGWRIFYLGSTEEVFTEGMSLLRKRYPHLMITGHDGYISIDGDDSNAVVREINAFCTDVLFVGMGMPLQEFWLSKHLSEIGATSVLTCGATLDYVTGHVYCPPAWAGPLGLYGVLRMLHDPKRMWRRYLAEPLVLGKMLIVSILRQRMQTTYINPG